MFNIKTGKKIFTFDVFAKKRITCLIATPHLHCVGVAAHDGQFHFFKSESLNRIQTTNTVIFIGKIQAHLRWFR